jgi:hypothetical protein
MSNRSATRPTIRWSELTSILRSGYCAISGRNRGHRTVSTACSMAVMRMVPAGLSPSWLTAATSAVMSSSRGATVCIRRSPASVGATLRIVRVNRRTPNRASRSRMVWLSEDCDMPSLAAARVKLRSRATAMKASRSLMESRVREWGGPWHGILPVGSDDDTANATTVHSGERQLAARWHIDSNTQKNPVFAMPRHSASVGGSFGGLDEKVSKSRTRSHGATDACSAATSPLQTSPCGAHPESRHTPCRPTTAALRDADRHTRRGCRSHAHHAARAPSTFQSSRC